MKIKVKKKGNYLFAIVVVINILQIMHSGCLEEVQQNKFTVESWSTMCNDNSDTFIFIEFNTNIREGTIDLFNPSDVFIDSQEINYEMQNVSFIISKSKSYKPSIGVYTLIVKEIELNTENIIMTKKLGIQDSQINVIKFIPNWKYNEIFGNWELKFINITMKNNGDVYGFIYEGRIIVDNSSIFIAPDYHWHNINLWFMPEQEISLELTVDVPWLEKGAHFIKIFMQDTDLNTVSLYESIIYTP